MTIDLGKNYEKISSYARRNFNDTIAIYCKLAICCTKNRIKLVIYNSSIDEIEVCLEYKVRDFNYILYPQILDNILSTKMFDVFRGKKIVLCLDSDKFTIFPKEFLPKEESNYKQYLDLACRMLPSERALYTVNEPSDEAIIFSIDSNLLDWFKKFNEGRETNIMHCGNALLAHIKKYIKTHSLSSQPTVSLFFTESSLHIIIMQKDSLQYYNRLNLSTGETSLSFVLNVMKHLKIDRMTHKVLFFGDNLICNAYLKTYKKYIKTITTVYKDGFINKFFYKKSNLESLHVDALGAQ